MIIALLAVSPLGKITRCDPGMLPEDYVLSPQQRTGNISYKTTSTKKDIARHTVPDCRGRTIDSKSKGCRGKKRTFLSS